MLRRRVFEVETLLTGHGEFKDGLFQLLLCHFGEQRKRLLHIHDGIHPEHFLARLCLTAKGAVHKLLWQRWPDWLYFCNLDTENLMMMVMCCLDSLDALKVQGQPHVQVQINPLEVVQFISGGFVPMNEMCERAGMNERQIFERTKAVFGYFNLPFDVEG